MEKEETKALPTQKKEDWLVIKLEKTVNCASGKTDKLDLTGLRYLTLDDMVQLYDIYNMNGGAGTVMQESTMLFAKIIAQRVSDFTLEELGTLSAKDAMKIKNRIYRFFYM